MRIKQFHIIICGNVQGVFFRNFVKKTADSLRLKGWVRNRPDGSVEIIVQGDDEILQEFIKHCKSGPLLAKVKSIKLREVPIKKFEGFEIIKMGSHLIPI